MKPVVRSTVFRLARVVARREFRGESRNVEVTTAIVMINVRVGANCRKCWVQKWLNWTCFRAVNLCRSTVATMQLSTMKKMLMLMNFLGRGRFVRQMMMMRMVTVCRFRTLR